MFENYLCDLDIDFSSLRHHIARKRIVSFKLQSKEVRDEFDKLCTAYIVAKNCLEGINQKFDRAYLLSAVKQGFSKNAALYKIANSMNESFMELISLYAFTDKSLVLVQLQREILEFFNAFYILSKGDDALASFYLNHSTVLEYNLLTEKEREVDYNLQEVYKQSVSRFGSYHSISFQKAEEIYRQPNGWCYKQLENNVHEKISSLSLHKHVLKEFQLDETVEFAKYIKTMDMMIHPTSAYLYYLYDFDTKESNGLYAITELASVYLNLTLSKLHTIMEEGVPEKRTLENVCEILEKINFKKVFTEIKLENNYDIINGMNKYEVKSFNRRLLEQIANFKDNNYSTVSFYDYYHNQLFSQSQTEKYLSKELDKVFTLFEALYENYNEFVVNLLPKSTKGENVTLLLHKVTLLLHDMATSYGLNKKKLFQKAYRLFYEYAAVLLNLLKANEDKNKNFFDLGYVLLEKSHLGETIEINQVEELISRVLVRVNLEDLEVDSTKLKDFTGWTIKKKKNKASFQSLNNLTQELHDSIEKSTKMSKSLFRESSAVLHGSLYGDLINNEIMENEYFSYTYMEFIYRVLLEIIEKYEEFVLLHKDEKLEKSIKEIVGTFFIHYDDFHRKSVKVHNKIVVRGM